MYCTNCGKELAPDDLYCNNCGKKIGNEVVDEVTDEVVETEGKTDGRKVLFIIFVFINCLIFAVSVLCFTFTYESANMFSQPDAMIDSLSFLGVFVSIFGGALGMIAFGIGMYLLYFVSCLVLIVNITLGIIFFINTKGRGYIITIVILFILHILWVFMYLNHIS